MTLTRLTIIDQFWYWFSTYYVWCCLLGRTFLRHKNQKEHHAKPVEKVCREKPAQKEQPQRKKDVFLKREPTVGDLFGDLFDKYDLDSKDKDNDTARTRQAESSSRENVGRWAVSPLSEMEYWTEALEQLDGEETARVSDTAGTVADRRTKGTTRTAEQQKHFERKSRRWWAERPMPERGQHRRYDANGRSAIARATDESQRTSRPAAEAVSSWYIGESRRGGRGNVASAKQPEPKFKRNYLYPETLRR